MNKMNSDFDHKADSLLRGFARSESDAAARLSDGKIQSGNVAGDASAHLDADDLNLYAENVLPSAARARYTAHLADCDRCRASLTALAPDSVVAAATVEDKSAVQPSASRDWRKHLARFFSQSVVRFGVPAFALLLVCVAAFFLTRTERRDGSLIALREQREEPALNTPAAPENANTGTTAANTAPLTENSNSAATNINSAQTQIASPRDSAPANETMARNDKESKSRLQPLSAPTAAAPPPPPVAATRPASPNELPDAARRPESSSSAPPASNSTAEAVSITGGADVARSRSNTNEFRQNAPSSGEDIIVQRVPQRDAANRTSAARAANEKEREPSRQTRRPATPPMSEERDDGQISVAETRSVAGRRFRRQNNVWVDVDYNSSMSTINVTRNSEQFRALAADEPALRRIANELGGEIIIRLNNRAYRIR